MNKITSSIFSSENSIYQAAPDASAESIEDTFQKVLSTMLLENTISGMGANPNSEGISSMPLMLTLLEQLVSRQVESTGTNDTNSTTVATSTTGSPQNFQISSARDTSQPSGRPVESSRVTQGSHPGHIALDFGVPVGTQVHTTMEGKVVYAGWNNEGYGNLVIVENGPYRTYYAHLSSIPVSVGQSVPAGSVIGLSGNTGNSTGPHLHYEIRLNNQHIDPTSVTLNPTQASV